MKQIRKIPGYGDKYLLTEDGVLYRYDEDLKKNVIVRGNGCPRRVRLYQNGTERRVLIAKLLEQVYWDHPEFAYNFRQRDQKTSS